MVIVGSRPIGQDYCKFPNEKLNNTLPHAFASSTFINTNTRVNCVYCPSAIFEVHPPHKAGTKSILEVILQNHVIRSYGWSSRSFYNPYHLRTYDYNNEWRYDLAANKQY